MVIIKFLVLVIVITSKLYFSFSFSFSLIYQTLSNNVNQLNHQNLEPVNEPNDLTSLQCQVVVVKPINYIAIV